MVGHETQTPIGPNQRNPRVHVKISKFILQEVRRHCRDVTHAQVCTSQENQCLRAAAFVELNLMEGRKGADLLSVLVLSSCDIL